MTKNIFFFTNYTRLSILMVVILSLCSISNINAQKKTKDFIEDAKVAEGSGLFYDAARNYEKAYRSKKGKPKHAYRAGELYLTVRDYERAEKILSDIQDESKEFNDVELLYGKSLMQTGKYDEAIASLVSFKNNLKGKGNEQTINDVDIYIKGCETAKLLAKAPTPYTIEHLGKNINSRNIEFAPIGLKDDKVLYYSATKNDKVSIVRSNKKNVTWSTPEKLEILKSSKDKRICNGSFTEDLNTFYFTICDLKTSSWSTQSASCKIYFIKKNGSKWTSPKKLGNDVNVENATNTQPSIATIQGRDYLFFASNRDGGYGGMDIWYVTKGANQSPTSFSNPTNLGSKLNTSKDELTPHFNRRNKKLYFSSNGHPSTGGFDIFLAEGRPNNISKIKNVGFPINSPADDLYYYQNEDNVNGYFVSNRKTETHQSTRDEDIFHFVGTPDQKHIPFAGQALDAEGKPVPSAIRLIDLNEGIEDVVAQVNTDADGNFNFELEESKKYLIRAFANDDNRKAELAVDGLGKSINENLVFESNEQKIAQNPLSEEVQKTIESTKVESRDANGTKRIVSSFYSSTPIPATNNTNVANTNTTSTIEEDIKQYTKPTGQEYIYSGNNDKSVYYKIQVHAVKEYNENRSRYNKVRKLGKQLTTEQSGRYIRVLLNETFSSQEEALSSLTMMNEVGFSKAKVVIFKNDKRLGFVE